MKETYLTTTQSMKKLPLGLLALAFSILAGAYFIANSTISIRSTQTEVTKDGSITNAISVSGDGTAVAEPDVVNIRVSISEVEPTVSEAQAKTAKKVDQIISISKDSGISENKIKTTRLSINPKYRWENRKSIFEGHESQQELMINIPYTGKDGIAAKIIDQVAQIEDVRINSISFDVENKKSLAVDAREEAYKSAEEKAKQLAELSGVELGKPISITDSSQQFNKVESSITKYAGIAADMVQSERVGNTQVLGGELEHMVRIQVVFAIK